MKLVQMPSELLHVEEADLAAASVDPSLLAAFHAYLPRAADERRGLLILVSASHGGRHLLMLLARRVGVALRDANIRLRDDGGNLTVGRQKLCYLPGGALGAALLLPDAHLALATEAACFIQDLEEACSPAQTGPASGGPDALRSLLDERLAAGLPTFLQAAPGTLPRRLEAELRVCLPVLEAAIVQA